MEGVKAREDLLGMWLFVCDADGGLVAELRVLGLCAKKQGWVSGEGKLEAQNKAFEDDVMKQWGMLEEFKAQSKVTGAKGKEHYLRNLRGGWKGSRRAWREKVGRKKGYCDMLPWK